MSPDQRDRGKNGHRAYQYLIRVNPADERIIDSEEFKEEANGWIEDQVHQENITLFEFVGITAREPYQQKHIHQVQ